MDLVVGADIVDAHDVGMAERGGRSGLTQKALAAFAVLALCRWKNLQGYGAPQAGVDGAVNNAHAALAEFGKHFVVENGFADHLRRSLQRSLSFARRSILAVCGKTLPRVG